MHLMAPVRSQLDLIGNTPLLEVGSLSKTTGCRILLKCENRNPGGSVKDRAALGMVRDALASGALRPGLTIVEGTAGNTGIGLALVGRALGFAVLVVMPRGQAQEKERMVDLFGAKLQLVDPVPFADENHFFHTARRIAESDPNKFWWANQFENLSNFRAHYETTGPEIWRQCAGKIDALVSVSGSGGTIAGTSRYLKEKNPKLHTALVDPLGSGLCSFVKTGEFKSTGSSITEGIGIMRLVANFKEAKVDEAFTLDDHEVVRTAYHLRERDGLVVGSSAALNVAGAVKVAEALGPGKTIVTFLCDGGERSLSKLYNKEFLKEKGLLPEP